MGLRSISHLGIFTALTALLFLSGCESGTYSTETQYLGGVYGSGAVSSAAPQDTVSFWDGEGVSGSPSIKIKISEQRAYFYKGNQLVGISQLSTGREETGTPTGKYKIIQKSENHVSNLYGDYVDEGGNVVMGNVGIKTHKKPPGASFRGAPMPFFMRITPGGVGMHAGYLPGYPASHGCIRMPEFMAKAFFENVSMGTPVTVSE